MRILGMAIAALMAVAVVGGPAAADVPGLKEMTKQGKFADVRDDVKNAIINRGYVIDYSGQFNSMLERTSEAVGGAKSPYANAEFMQFCAAKLTHGAIAASPENIVNCPYVVYVYETVAKPGVVHMGYRQPISGGSDASRAAVAKIEALLGEIVAEAAK